MRHRVPQQVRMQANAGQDRILVAQRPDASFRKRSSFSDEKSIRHNRRARIQVRLQRLPCWQGQRHRPLLVALPVAQHQRTAPVVEHQVVKFKPSNVGNAQSPVQHDGENRRRPDIATQFQLAEQPPHLTLLQSFGGKLLAPKFLHPLGRIGDDVTAICEPLEKLPDGDQQAIHGGDRLTLLPPKVISKVGYIPGRHSANDERLSVGPAQGRRACSLTAPVDNLLSNWAYMVIGSLAWSLKAWAALMLPEEGSRQESHREEKRKLLRMDFTTFRHAMMKVPAQVLSTGRRIINRFLAWNPWQHVFFRLLEQLHQPLRC